MGVEAAVESGAVWWTRDGEGRADEVFKMGGGGHGRAGKSKRNGRRKSAGTSKAVLLATERQLQTRKSRAALPLARLACHPNRQWHGC